MFNISILDVGNSISVAKAVSHALPDSQVTLISTGPSLMASDCLIIPGVGTSYGHIQFLESNLLIDPLFSYVAHAKPLIGICAGFHILSSFSQEDIYQDLLQYLSN